MILKNSDLNKSLIHVQHPYFIFLNTKIVSLWKVQNVYNIGT